LHQALRDYAGRERRFGGILTDDCGTDLKSVLP